MIREKSFVKTDILVEKDYKLVCDGKYPICIKCPPFLSFAYPLRNKLSSTAKNYALLFSPNHPTIISGALILIKDKDLDKTQVKLFPNFTSIPFDNLLIFWVANYVHKKRFSFSCLLY